MLEVRCFKTIDPGAPRIEWLGDRVCARRGPRNRGLIIGNDSGPRNDRLGQVLVEVTGGNHSKRVDVMFDQDVHVGRRFGAEAGVAEGDGVPRVIRANEIVRDGLSNVLRIRTREAPAIDGAQVSVLAEGESERGTRQSLQIRAVIITDSKRSEERRVGKECRSRWSAYH